MNTEIRNCKNCQNTFQIEPDDFSFYKKIKVPPPVWCPSCRQRRRYSWRNERTLYRRNCDKTGKSIVSIYNTDSPYVIYDTNVWWGDSWSPLDYGQDFDFTRPFFEQFKELQLKVPRLALLHKNCTNSDYCNHSNDSKDCYLCFTTFGSENVLHSTNIVVAKNSSDCYKVYGKSNENLYECIDIYNSYNCQFCFVVHDSFDCNYCFDLKNCSNCFLSSNLRGQSYYFMNQKYSKEEYFEKIQQYNLSSFEVRTELYKEWKKLIFEQALHRGMFMESSVNSTGSMIFYSKNARNCFDAEKVEDCRYIDFTTGGLKDSYDLYHVGINTELLYECHAIVRSSNLIGVHLSYDNTNLSYCDSCHNSNELFGCVGIKKGAYCIFNKQYSKEEYLILKEKIIEHMKTTGEYGQFFPSSISPFGYNETQAQLFFPLSKEQALEQGFLWQDNMPGTYGRETLLPENIPDDIREVDDTITKQVLKCIRTGKNYNIVDQELLFYKQHNIPIPRLHPDERYKDRMALRPNRQIYDAVCAVTGVQLQTAYPPERRPKMIVTDEIYQKEVL